ncbi:hypothetical protein A7U60_g8484 [Sanghuangporus baumii]|uniref:Uncharacterized protein n=1 Tax=Sanghuangporus baumii TaxID=108892 RepID=A0A9Q5N4M1_SANBA|nr:hypothetical protein A7U60_g8484 [Sanghuangporus baumii]
MGHILTVFPLFVLISLSFLVFLVEGSALASPDLAARHARQFAVKRAIVARQNGNGPGQGGGDDEGEGNGPDDSSQSVLPSSTTEGTSTTSATSSTETTSSSTSFGPPTTTSSSSSSSISTSSSSSSTITSSSSEFIPSSTSSSSTFSSTPTSSTSLSTTSSSSSQTSSSTLSSSSRTTSQVTTVSASTATAVVAASSNTLRVSSSSSATSSVATSAEASSTESAASNGFLSNKGAMAGTFTAVGIIAVGLICAIVVFIRKRKRSEDLDIFDTEYKEYSSGNDVGGTSCGNDDYFASDMSSLSANAVSHAGAHAENMDYNHADYGYGVPPTAADRTSVASNHAGYGAFRSATEQRKPPMQSSGLRNEMNWNNDAAYAEPAVDENQSMHIVPHDDSHYYASATRVPGTAY